MDIRGKRAGATLCEFTIVQVRDGCIEQGTIVERGSGLQSNVGIV